MSVLVFQIFNYCVIDAIDDNTFGTYLGLFYRFHWLVLAGGQLSVIASPEVDNDYAHASTMLPCGLWYSDGI